MTKLQATEIVPLPISNAHQDLMNCSSDESAGEEVEGDSDDEFAREMGDEIRSTMPFLCKKKEVQKEPAAATVAEQQFYDDVYFNSSDEEEGEGNKDKKKVVPDEDLFYDPQQDDDDEKWVNNKRKNYLKSDKNQKEVDPSTAVLCCPACMTVLCRDCQQHETHKDQFRAMFVFNCLVCTDEVLTYKEKMSQRQRKKLKNLTPSDEKTEDSEDKYHPVKCSVCQTKVAVYDSDEVYHFFNILTTHP